jgi:dihydroxy-acid dehydratase
VGGPIAYVKDGDRIRIDIPGRTLSLLVSDEELAGRKAAVPIRKKQLSSPVLRKYVKLVGSVSEGARLDDSL